MSTTTTATHVRVYELTEITTEAGTIRRPTQPGDDELIYDDTSGVTCVDHLIHRVYAEIEPREDGRSVVIYRATDDYLLASGHYLGEDEAEGWDGAEQVLVQTSDAEALAAALLTEPHLDDHIRALPQVCSALRIQHQPVDQEPEYTLVFVGLEYAHPDDYGVREPRPDPDEPDIHPLREQGVNIGLRAIVSWEYSEALPPTENQIADLIRGIAQDNAGKPASPWPYLHHGRRINWVDVDVEAGVEVETGVDVLRVGRDEMEEMEVIIHYWAIELLEE